MPCRVSLIFQGVTHPQNPSQARAHTMGWSEGLWAANAVDPASPGVAALAIARARLLPATVSIIGARSQLYDYSVQANRLIPRGSVSSKFQFTGITNTLDVPQAALGLVWNLSGQVNKPRYVMRGFPDEWIVGGEFTGGPFEIVFVNAFMTAVADGSWKSLIRDLTKPAIRILSVNGAGVVTLDQAPYFGAGAYVRFNRVKDTTGKPVKGSFYVQSVGPGSQCLIPSLGTTVVVESGFLRQDSLTLGLITGGNIGRAMVKKVGLPLERYRGRRSKRR